MKASSLNVLAVVLVGLALLVGGQVVVGAGFVVLAPLVLIVSVLVPSIGQQRVSNLAQRNGLEYPVGSRPDPARR